jgi:hypothetical protein
VKRTVAVIVVVEDHPKSLRVGRLQFRYSSAAIVVELMGVIP